MRQESSEHWPMMDLPPGELIMFIHWKQSWLPLNTVCRVASGSTAFDASPGHGVSGSSSRCPSPPPPASLGSVSVKGVVVAAAARYRYAQPDTNGLHRAVDARTVCVPPGIASAVLTSRRSVAPRPCLSVCVSPLYSVNRAARKGGRCGARVLGASW